MAPVPGSTEIVTRCAELIAGLRPDNAELLTALHRIQHAFGYVPREAVPLLAGQFLTTPAIIYGTIDFYSEIRQRPPAEEVVDWCSGPACLLKGSMQIRAALEAVLGCYMGQASIDGKYELRLVQCDGTCHLAPLIRHRGRYLGPLSTSEAIRWARDLKERAGPPGPQAEAAAAGDEPSPEEAPGGGAAPGPADRELPGAQDVRSTEPEQTPRPALPADADTTREPGE